MVKLNVRDQQQMDKARDLMPDQARREGFVRGLFFGRLHFDAVTPYPKQDPDDARRTKVLLKKIDYLLEERIDADRIDAEERIPQHIIDELGRIGVLGMTVPQEYGGGGFSHTAYCRVLQRIARHCASTAVLVGAHQSIGLKALVLNGNPQQKRRYLPDLASGKKLAAFALSEPEAGSDAANVQSRAVLSDDGQYWILNGRKKYITNGAMAGFMTVMARTKVEVDGERRDKVTAFIVTPDMPGFEVVRRNRSKMGIRGTWQAELKFTDMKVPVENVLGELGKGLKVALTVLDFGRCTLSAGCLGGAQEALARSIEHVKQRVQFDRRLADFEAIRHKIARMAELNFAMEAMTYLAAGAVDRHDDSDLMLETAATKLFCSEAAWRVIDDAVQMHGGEGYMRDKGLERMMRDARINRIVEGATEVMTSFMALIGCKNVGEEFEQVMAAAHHPIDRFDRLRAFARHEWRDVIIGTSVSHLHPKLRSEGRVLSRLTRSLARNVTVALARHQAKILDMQMLQQRIAWAAVELYAMAAVISRLQSMIQTAESNGGVEQTRREITIGKGFCTHAARRIRTRLRGMRGNADDVRRNVARAVLD